MSPIAGVPTTVLVAPDSFKGTLTAAEVAAAIGRGLEAPAATSTCARSPTAARGRWRRWRDALGRELSTACACTDPLGREIEASLRDRRSRGDRRDGRGQRSAPGQRRASATPFAASTAGTGELIVAAVAAGAETVYLGVGGSATTDGGAGAIRAIQRGAAGSARRSSSCSATSALRSRTPRACSPRRRAPTPSRCESSPRGCTRSPAAGRATPAGMPMTGAAGGLSGGLWAVLGAELVPGAAFVLDAIGFDARMRAARAVVTGEGKLDAQSLTGKVVSEVATRARQAGVPCHAIVGTRELDTFGARILDLQTVREAGTPAALRPRRTSAGRRALIRGRRAP